MKSDSQYATHLLTGAQSQRSYGNRSHSVAHNRDGMEAKSMENELSL